MLRGSWVLWGCSALPAVLFIHLSCAKMVAFQFYLKSRKQSRVCGGYILFLVKNALVKNEVWEGVLSWCNSQFFCYQVWVEVFSHLHAVAVKHHSSMWNWLFGLPGWIPLWTMPLIWKKMMSNHLTLLYTCLIFFGLGDFGLSVYGSCFLPRTLV
jgi:hypothetical protein